MNAPKNRPAPSENELMTFQFSESQTEIRSLVVNDEPWLVAKDICNVLGLSDTNKALLALDEDEKLTRKLFVSGQNRKVWVVNESGMYALIMRSNKPQAKSFRKWVTSEVLPSIRKKGHYKAYHQKNDFIDARDIPFYTKPINGFHVRCIEINGEVLVSVNDINKAIHSSTQSNQLAKKLNQMRTLAYKVWVFGNTHPAWFTNQIGVNLILAGSRNLKVSNQLSLQL